MTEPAQQAAPAPADLVDVVNPKGERVKIAKADVARALQPENGYSLAPAAAPETPIFGTYAKLRGAGVGVIPSVAAQAVVGPESPELQAWKAGGIHGATAGLGDVAQKEIATALFDKDAGQAVARGIQKAQTEQAGVFEAGSIGGMIAGAAVGGAAGAGATATEAVAASNPAALISGAGGIVEGGVGRLTAGLATRGVLGQAAAAGINLGARGAVEGALYGGVSQLSEDMLGDHELNAEKLLAAAYEQGKAGALLGAGIGAGGSLVKSAGKGLSGLIADAAAGSAKDIRGAEYEQLWMSTSGRKAFAQEAEARLAAKPDLGLEGGTKGVGQAMKEYGVSGATLEDAITSGHPSAVAERIDAAREAVGQKLGEIHASSKATVKWGDILDETERVIAPLREGAGGEPVVRSLETYQESLARKLGVATPDQLRAGLSGVATPEDVAATLAKLRETEVPVQSVINQRKFLDELVYRETKALDPNMRVRELRNVRSKLNDLTVNAIDNAAKEAGDPSAGARLRKLAHDYQALSIAGNAAEDAASRIEMANRTVSPTDYYSAGTAAKLGATVGGFAGGAPGAALGGVAGGVAGGMLNHGLRMRGNAIAANLLDKLATYAETQAALRQVDTKIATAADGIVNASKAVRPKLRAKPATSVTDPLPTRYQRAVKQTVDMQSDAEDFTRRVSERPSPTLPKTSSAISAALVRTASFLSQARPPASTPPVLGSPPSNSVDSVTATSYLRQHDTATNPLGALDAFARGNVSPDAVRTLQQVSPKMFEQLQRGVLAAVAKRAPTSPLPLDARLRIGLMLGIETDPALRPDILAALQQSINTPPEDAGPKPRTTPVNLKSTPVGLDRLEASS